MTQHKYGESGFTIIEVIFFLAISSFLIAIAVASIGSRTARVQFTDSIRSLESFLERRISYVENGSLVGDQATCTYAGGSYDLSQPSDGTCVFLGYMFEYGDVTQANPTNPSHQQIYVYQMFGRRLTSVDIASCPDQNELLSCAEPIRVPQTPVETYDIMWGTRLVDTDYYENPLEIKAHGVFRNPGGQNLVAIAVADQAHAAANYAEVFDEAQIYERAFPNSKIDGEFEGQLCFEGDRGYQALISLGADDRQTAAVAQFDDAVSGGYSCGV